MRIAYFLDIPSGLGGAGNLLLQQAYLMSKLHDVIVVIPCNQDGIGNEEYIKRCKRKGLRYECLSYNTSYDFKSVDVIGAVESYDELKQFVIQEKIDFLHSVQINIVVEKIARDLNIPHMMNIYQISKEEFMFKQGDFYPQFHLCDSELYAKVWSSNMDIYSRCLRPLAPLEHIRRKDKSIDCMEITLLMLGTVCNRKNQFVAIQAVEECIREGYDIKLLIAGDGDKLYLEKCKEYVAQNELQDKIEFLGFVSDVEELLKKSDCFLCTSLDESFPSSIVEAATYDLTIITTPVAGVPEVYINGYNGYVSKDYSWESITVAIKECMDAYQSGDIVRLQDNARNTWKEQYSQDSIRKGLEEYYQYICDNYVYKKDHMEEMYIRTKNIYDLVQGISSPNDMVKRNCMYYSFLKEYITPCKAYLWGAGACGKAALELIDKLQLPIEVIAFVDKVKTGMYCDIPIIKSEEIIYSQDTTVFLCFWGYKKHIWDELEALGFRLHHSIWELP